MMRIQYESIIEKIYKIIDEELEIDTLEGSQLFRDLCEVMFQYHPDVIKKKIK